MLSPLIKSLTCAILGFSACFAVDLPITPGNGHRIWHDNDQIVDAATYEFCMALASSGRATLAGHSVTRDSFGGGYFNYEQLVADCEELTRLCRESGWKNIPDPLRGPDRQIVVPASRQIDDTVPLEFPAVDALIAAALASPPGEPLLICTGNQQYELIASAYLKNPAIADKIIVISDSTVGYAGFSFFQNGGGKEWAAIICADRLTMINYPRNGSGGPNFVVPWLGQDWKQANLPDYAAKPDLLDREHSFAGGDNDGDSATVLVAVMPGLVTGVRRMRLQNLSDNDLVEDPNGNIYEITNVSDNQATAGPEGANAPTSLFEKAVLSDPLTWHLEDGVTVSLTTPSNEIELNPGADLVLAAAANDSNGSITKVEFVFEEAVTNQETILATDTSAPFTATVPWTWPVGTYRVRARAYDNDGNARLSSHRFVRVRGLLAHWPMTENGGADFADVTGLGWGGSLEGGGVLGDGKLTLDGNGEWGRTDTDAEALGLGSNLTVAARVQCTTNGSGWFPVIATQFPHVSSPKRGFNIEYRPSSQTLRFYAYRSSARADNVNLNDGEHHIAAVMTGRSTVRIYVDGVDMTSNSTIDDYYYSRERVFFGQVANTFRTKLFRGTLADVRIYNYALSAGEVANLADGGGSPNTQPTVDSITATPATVTSSTAALSATGSDDDGDTLTYTWSVTSKPDGAADPTYSVNGTTAADNTTATFSRAGNYTFRVTIDDDKGGSATDTVPVIVQQTAEDIDIE